MAEKFYCRPGQGGCGREVALVRETVEHVFGGLKRRRDSALRVVHVEETAGREVVTTFNVHTFLKHRRRLEESCSARREREGTRWGR